MKIEDLSLTAINAHGHLAVSPEVVAAVSYGARRGRGDHTLGQFVTALVMTDNLRSKNYVTWKAVLDKLDNLKISADLAALEVEGMVEGDLG